MSVTRRTSSKLPQERWYRGANVPRGLIRQFARRIAEQFQPDKVILFGSYAYGTPHADSDVDMLVVMPTKNQLNQAFRIHSKLLPPFPLDIIVRTPRNMKWRLAEGDSFLQEIVAKGKVLYEKGDAGVGAKGGKRLSRRASNRRRRRVLS